MRHSVQSVGKARQVNKVVGINTEWADKVFLLTKMLAIAYISFIHRLKREETATYGSKVWKRTNICRNRQQYNT